MEREFYVEFDMIDLGFNTAFYYCENEQECRKMVLQEFKTWGDSGHADVFEDGNFLFDVEI